MNAYTVKPLQHMTSGQKWFWTLTSTAPPSLFHHWWRKRRRGDKFPFTVTEKKQRVRGKEPQAGSSLGWCYVGTSSGHSDARTSGRPRGRDAGLLSGHQVRFYCWFLFLRRDFVLVWWKSMQASRSHTFIHAFSQIYIFSIISFKINITFFL